MVACELAAAYPRRVRRLTLIDPIGFWRDADPIVNWVKLSPAELPNYIFRNPAIEAAQRLLGPSEPPDAAIAARVRLMWAMGATSKFIWPIPDKGLKKRIHRVSAPTLIVWGADDRLVPTVYAEEFSRRLAGAQVHIIEGAGHAPHVEHPATVAGLVRDFLTAAR
jgi:pimeloyl-ACP methyl ester carboxylesterase